MHLSHCHGLRCCSLSNQFWAQIAYLENKWDKLLSYSVVSARYLGLLVLPIDLCHAHSQANIPIVAPFSTKGTNSATRYRDRLIFPSILVATALFVICWLTMGIIFPRYESTSSAGIQMHSSASGRASPKRQEQMPYDDQRRLQISLGLNLLLVSFIPASNMLAPVGFHLAERILYMPSIGNRNH